MPLSSFTKKNKNLLFFKNIHNITKYTKLDECFKETKRYNKISTKSSWGPWKDTMPKYFVLFVTWSNFKNQYIQKLKKSVLC